MPAPSSCKIWYGLLALTLGVLLLPRWVATGWLPGCAFLARTGHPCGGCGTWRMLEAVNAGQFAEALRLQPFFFALLAAGLVIPALNLWRIRAGEARPPLTGPQRKFLWVALLAAFAINWGYLYVQHSR